MAYNSVMDLLTRVRTDLEVQELLRPGQTVVVGISGGPDSLCLLDVLHRLAVDWNLRVQVAHLNHRLRPEAAVEAEFVRAEAEQRDLPFHTETCEVRAYAAQHKQSMEEAARNCRYAFLTRLAEQIGAAHIAVAHTADDQAETVLMHVLRGSGLAGLRGMLPKTEMRNLGFASPNAQWPLALIRPLLHVSRTEVVAYCAEHHLTPVQDPSNTDITFFRNRLRHELLPELETYNPNIRAVLSRTADVAAGEHELLERSVADLWKRVVLAEGLAIEFRRERWLALTVPEQRALLRRAIQRLRADERDVDFAPLEHAVRFTHRARPGRSCEVLAGLKLKIASQAILLHDEAYRPVRADMPLLTNGILTAGWRFDSRRLETFTELETNTDPWHVWVDAKRLENTRLHLRTRFPGDRIQPLGMNGHSLKLSDVFINAKIDRALRDRWPLVVNGDDIVWVAGLRLDERFKVTPDTQIVLHLSFTKIE